MTIDYPEMRRAFAEAGWLEIKDKAYDEILDCRFCYAQSDINFKKMKPGCWINHNPGEGALTMKSDLVTSLETTLPLVESMYPMKFSDPDGYGERSFFPRCFNLKSGEGCDDFLHDYYFTEAENTLKKFCKTFKKVMTKVLENESKFPPKERLYVCCNMNRKRLEDPDDVLEKKHKGIRGKFRLSSGEWNFLKHEGEQG